MFSLLTVLLILIESLLAFDENNVFFDNINLQEKDTLVFAKINDDTASYLEFTQEDEEKIFSDLDCEKYKIYNYSPMINYYNEPYFIE